jgi:hypothetical protein
MATPPCTLVSADVRPLVSRAGEPVADRTLIETDDGAAGVCPNGRYIVAGTGSRSDR